MELKSVKLRRIVYWMSHYMKTSCHPSNNQWLAARERPPVAVVMKQRWSHLLFLHWEIAPETPPVSSMIAKAVDVSILPLSRI